MFFFFLIYHFFGIAIYSRYFKICLTGQYERVGHIGNNTSATCNVDIRRLKPTSKAYVFVHTANGPEAGPQDHGNQMEPIGPLWTTLFKRCNSYTSSMRGSIRSIQLPYAIRGVLTWFHMYLQVPTHSSCTDSGLSPSASLRQAAASWSRDSPPGLRSSFAVKMRYGQFLDSGGPLFYHLPSGNLTQKMAHIFSCHGYFP